MTPVVSSCCRNMPWRTAVAQVRRFCARRS
jgi:hypothetical protein